MWVGGQIRNMGDQRDACCSLAAAMGAMGDQWCAGATGRQKREFPYCMSWRTWPHWANKLSQIEIFSLNTSCRLKRKLIKHSLIYKHLKIITVYDLLAKHCDTFTVQSSAILRWHQAILQITHCSYGFLQNVNTSFLFQKSLWALFTLCWFSPRCLNKWILGTNSLAVLWVLALLGRWAQRAISETSSVWPLAGWLPFFLPFLRGDQRAIKN